MFRNLRLHSKGHEQPATTVNLLAFAYIVRHWRQLFGRDPNVYEDVDAARWLRMIVVVIPLFVLTFRLTIELVGLWIK